MANADHDQNDTANESADSNDNPDTTEGTPPEHAADIAQSFVRTFVYLAVGALLFVGAIAAGFGLIRWTTADGPGEESVDPANVRKAQHFREQANALVRLVNSYAERIPADLEVIPPSDLAWARQGFVAKVNERRQALGGSEYFTSPAFRDLQAAADRIASMGRNPSDRNLRKFAMRALQAAQDAAEIEIARLDADTYLGEPPAVLRAPARPDK